MEEYYVMRKSFLLFSVVIALIIFSVAAYSEDVNTNFDFVRFAKEKVLTDFHPTSSPSKAVAEYDEKPFIRNEGIIRARVKMYYTGWVRKHYMLIDIDLKTLDNSVKVTVLNDTNGMNFFGNSTFKEDTWVKLSDIGWE